MLTKQTLQQQRQQTLMPMLTLRTRSFRRWRKPWCCQEAFVHPQLSLRVLLVIWSNSLSMFGFVCCFARQTALTDYINPPPTSRLSFLFERSTVTFPASDCHLPWPGPVPIYESERLYWITCIGLLYCSEITWNRSNNLLIASLVPYDIVLSCHKKCNFKSFY